jgi:hypothetical protein
MKTQAWGWLAAAVVAAGLNASYHDGGLQWAHRVTNRIEHRTAAVVALATGHADRFLAEAKWVTSDFDSSERVSSDRITLGRDLADHVKSYRVLAKNVLTDDVASDEPGQCPWTKALARAREHAARLDATADRMTARAEAMADRREAEEEAREARMEANRERIEAEVTAHMARIHVPNVSVNSAFNPVAFKEIEVSCPRVHVRVPRMPELPKMPKIEVPAVPMVHIDTTDDTGPI